MSSTELTATLNFLTDAAHLLVTTAPEVSSFLMNQRGNLLFENEIPQSDVQRQHVCSSCSHIMVANGGTTLKIEHKNALEKKSRSIKRHKEKAVPCSTPSGPSKVLNCGRCHRFTKVNLPPPVPISRRKIKKEDKPKAASMQTQTPQNPTSSQKVTANASSKKRAKSRKAGLQALLDQTNASQPSRPGLGLSLADFMKK